MINLNALKICIHKKYLEYSHINRGYKMSIKTLQNYQQKFLNS